MATEDNRLDQRKAALRLILGSAGAMVLLLTILAVVRPDMAMSAMHYMEAITGM